MADFHCSVKPVQRSAGRTATAAAAYRAGVEIADTRTGEIHDYTRKGGVASADIVLPEGAPEWAADRSALWNAAEHAERRKDACVAREYEVALPCELSPEARRSLVLAFAKEMADREGCAVDVAIHEPGRGGDDRNHHAHILRTTRKVGADGLTDKLDTEKAGRNRKEDLAAVRARWAELTNEKLRQYGIEASVDHRSLADQGIEREPTRHLGPTATGIERRTGEPSRRRHDMRRDASDRRASAAQRVADEFMRDSLKRRIGELVGELSEAKNEQVRERAAKAAALAQVDLYAQALENVTSETLATVLGILPIEAIRQAAAVVQREFEEVTYAKEIDLGALGLKIVAQPLYQSRLAAAADMEAVANEKIESIAGMSAMKRILNDAKGMQVEASKMLEAAKLERHQVNNAVRLSPEIEAARKENTDLDGRRRLAAYALAEIKDVVPRIDKGETIYQRQQFNHRLPEAITRVVEKARQIALKMVAAMQTVDVEKMIKRAIDVAWKSPGNVNEPELMKSRFVQPAEQRQHAQEQNVERSRPSPGRPR